MIWTDEITETVKGLWLGGLSATLIGRQLGVTRNCVIGKVSRMGWVRGGCTIPVKDSATWTDDVDARLRALADMREHRPYNRRSSPEAVGLRTSELGKPLDLGEGDQRYVEAVLRAGGFRYLIKLPNGKYAEVRP